MADMTDHDILAELGVDLALKPVRARTPREERIIAGFEDIVKFREEHGRVPLTWPGSRHLRTALRRPPRPPARAGRLSCAAIGH
jgi:hypothetical protein